MGTLGVGFLGAGPVTQAIHLPALATLGDRFRVVHVMDADAPLAAAVASRVGARSTPDAEELLADPAVDVVAICSPHRFHAEQVEAACAAGKRAILCEKPLALDADGLERIVTAVRSGGVPLVVGTMHVYDPAVQAAWAEPPVAARLVRSVIVLPPNDRMVAAATELHPGSPPPPAPEAPGAALAMAVLGLATHNLPLVRRFAPAPDEVEAARLIRPDGYAVTFRSGDVAVQLLAAFHAGWRPDWTLEAWGEEEALHVAFPPSYVLAGSATVSRRSRGAERTWRFPQNGYQAEWLHLADVVHERVTPLAGVEAAADDLRFALALAGAAAARLEAGA